MSDHEARNKPFPVVRLVGAWRGKTAERNKERGAALLLYFLRHAQLSGRLEEDSEEYLYSKQINGKRTRFLHKHLRSHRSNILGRGCFRYLGCRLESHATFDWGFCNSSVISHWKSV